MRLPRQQERPRSIVHFATVPTITAGHVIYALSDDGVLFRRLHTDRDSDWEKLPPLPVRKAWGD